MQFDAAIYYDAVKLIGQLIVSLFVTWLAVLWAFRRFKKEKLWEKRLQAYADVAEALGVMQLILGRWVDDLEGLRSYSGKEKKAFNYEYRLAKRRFEQTAAVAQLILPKQSASTLNELAQKLEANDGLDFNAICEKFGVIEDALSTLLAQGRIELG